MGLAFGWCCDRGKYTGIRIGGVWCGHTNMVGELGGGVTSETKGAVGPWLAQ